MSQLPDPRNSSWDAVVSLLRRVIDLEESAARTGAFRKARGVPSAVALLRLCLAYAVCALSLRQACAWAASAGVARLSNPALEKRFQKAGPWLGEIAGALLAGRAALRQRWPGYRVRLIDGTTLSAPGATGITWRLHLCFDLGTLRMRDATLTDAHGGERLSRVAAPDPTTIDVADAGYPHPRELRAHRSAGGHFIVRIGWSALRLLGPDDAPFALFDRLRALTGATGEWTVRIDDHQPDREPLEVRLVAGRKPPQACEQARRRVRATAKRKGKTPDARTLEAAEWVLAVTTLPAETFDADAVLATYRLRWQVELAIKRWKSLLDLGDLPLRSPQAATCWIYAKLIAALLVEDRVAAEAAQLPPRQSAGPPGLLRVEALRLGGPSPGRHDLRRPARHHHLHAG